MTEFDWKAGERSLLTHLALNGPADQGKVSKAYDFPPPTINVAKDSLIERGYIRMVGTIRIGRGAPKKVYALTPAGLIAAVLDGNLWNQIDAVLRHWMDIAPIFIKRYETLSEWNFNTELQDFCKSTLVKFKILIEVLGKAADQYTCYTTGKGEVVFTTEKGTHEYRTIDPWMGLIKMLDRSFFNEITKSFIVSETARSINMVKSDPALTEGWLKWFEMEEERLKMLKKARRYLLNDHE